MSDRPSNTRRLALCATDAPSRAPEVFETTTTRSPGQWPTRSIKAVSTVIEPT
jgi:hypothetical protein